MQDLPDPTVRSHPRSYRPYTWSDGATVQLAARFSPLNLDFARLIENRQTRREFQRVPTILEIADFFWFACRSRNSSSSAYGPELESRVHPSAGALHPIHVLYAEEGRPWSRYAPTTHELIEQTGTYQSAAATRAAMDGVVPSRHAALLALIAEPGKTAAKYDNVDTLVWRDAGVVLGYMSIVAEALGLGFCPLGPTGRNLSTRGLPDEIQLRSVGLALIAAL